RCVDASLLRRGLPRAAQHPDHNAGAELMVRFLVQKVWSTFLRPARLPLVALQKRQPVRQPELLRRVTRVPQRSADNPESCPRMPVGRALRAALSIRWSVRTTAPVPEQAQGQVLLRRLASARPQYAKPTGVPPPFRPPSRAFR